MKQLLQDSFNRVSEAYSLSVDMLSVALQRVDNTLDNELKAWKRVAIEYGGILVDEILAKDPQGGRYVSRNRLSKFMNDRETVYNECKGQAASVLHQKIGALLQTQANDYLNMLSQIFHIKKARRIPILPTLRRS